MFQEEDVFVAREELLLLIAKSVSSFAVELLVYLLPYFLRQYDEVAAEAQVVVRVLVLFRLFVHLACVVHLVYTVHLVCVVPQASVVFLDLPYISHRRHKK